MVTRVDLEQTKTKPVFFKFALLPEFNYMYKPNKVFTTQFLYTHHWEKFEGNYDYNTSSYNNDTLIKSTEIGLNVGVSRFASNIAPIGIYYAYRIGFSVHKIPRRLGAQNSYSPITYTYNYENKTVPQIVFAVGKKRVFYDCLVLDYNLDFDLGSLLLTRYVKSQYYSNTGFTYSSNGLRFLQSFYIQFGASYLF